MDAVTKHDLKCPCCDGLNRSINLIETQGTMECIHCHVVVHMRIKPDGSIEIIGYDGEPYYSNDAEEDL